VLHAAESCLMPTPDLRQLLRGATARLGENESAALEAELLLCHALQRARSFLFSHPEHLPDADALARFESLLEARRQGHPVAHLLGRREFWSLPLAVSADTLIPRPETEYLVDAALERLPKAAVCNVLDLGTGSGAIALAIASERPCAKIIATDRSEPALTVARSNAEALGLMSRITFFEGDWYAPVPPQRFDLIVSNPPYIRADDPHLGQGDLRFEPLSALASGADGLDAIRCIVHEATAWLVPGGWLLLEHGYDQGEAVRALLSVAGFSEVSTLQDLEGRDRVSLGRVTASGHTEPTKPWRA